MGETFLDRFEHWTQHHQFKRNENGDLIWYKSDGGVLLDATDYDAMRQAAYNAPILAATIATLTAALEEARGALDAFAKKCDKHEPSFDDTRRPDSFEVYVGLGDLRRARSALATINAALGRVEG